MCVSMGLFFTTVTAAYSRQEKNEMLLLHHEPGEGPKLYNLFVWGAKQVNTVNSEIPAAYLNYFV